MARLANASMPGLLAMTEGRRTRRKLLDRLVASESIGTRQAPTTREHLEGFVAEHLWHLLTTEDALTHGIPIGIDAVGNRLGGDGLADRGRTGPRDL